MGLSRARPARGRSLHFRPRSATIGGVHPLTIPPHTPTPHADFQVRGSTRDLAAELAAIRDPRGLSAGEQEPRSPHSAPVTQ